MKIRAIALDFDGVLTDGAFSWSINDPESETKTMSFRDRTGIAKAIAFGIPVAIITAAHPDQIAHRYAEVFGCLHYSTRKHKLEPLRAFTKSTGVKLNEIAYMGDDETDIPPMQLVGLSGAPCDAWYPVLELATFRSTMPGGKGAVRQFIEVILRDYQ